MSKRVNITYSVRFDKILETMGDLVNKAHNSEYRPLNKDFDELLASISRKNEKESLQKIQEIREKLMNIDVCLSDCHGIISAYQKQLLQPEENVENDESL
jgi:Mg2+ and Co2+ transporter CorA